MTIFKKFFNLNILYKILTLAISLLWTIFIIFGFTEIIQKKFLYPIHYKEYVEESCTEYSLSKAIVFAVIKAESNFDSNAVSRAGAIGLMQISPDTAEYIAENLEIKEYDLIEAKTNIRFGCYYLSYLKEKFSILENILCAYNAGEGNVYKWLSNKNYSDNGTSLKKIPFKETEQYVEKVQKYFKKYINLYGNLLDK